MRLIPGLGRTPGGGNGNLFQYSCLKNPIDRGAWWAPIHGITKSETWLRTHTQRDVLEVPWVPEKIFVSVAWGAQRNQGLVLTVKNCLLFQPPYKPTYSPGRVSQMLVEDPGLPGQRQRNSRQIEIHDQVGRQIPDASCSSVLPKSSSCLSFYFLTVWLTSLEFILLCSME